ncbi:MAG: RnfH family protein [Marinospirillum sp.]|nr:RnfH family protein [Marinospirillum sp.]
MLTLEVAYALPEKQKILTLQVPQETCIRDAVLMSGMEQHFSGLDLQTAKLGIFGRQVMKPEEQLVREGDRIEIYRPLIADPKASRATRAAKKAGQE